MAASRPNAGIARNLGVRAVHLQLVPRPQSIVERRSILNLIEEYGPVEMFKSLKYVDVPVPNTMLAIFRTEEAALKLLRASPIRFSFSSDSDQKHANGETSQASYAGSPGSPSAHQPDLGTEPAHSSTAMSSDRAALAANATRSSSAALSTNSAAPGREYQLQVNVATVHHRDQINVNRYHGPFLVTGKSAIQEDLAKRVPTYGLSDSDLKAPEKHWRILDQELERGRKTHKTLRQMLDEHEVWKSSRNKKAS